MYKSAVFNFFISRFYTFAVTTVVVIFKINLMGVILYTCI